MVHAPLASQQPFGHEVASHTHLPSTHLCPATHAGPVPQVHALPKQRSVTVRSQTPQAPPGAPHVVGVGLLQVPLASQQPAVQEVASHTHAPATQRWPGAHARWPPQAHWPDTHASARVLSHAMQVAPPLPHAVIEVVAHIAPAQQPLGHEVASHTQAPPTQR